MGEEEKDTLKKSFMERFGSGGDWRRRSLTAAIERKRDEKKRDQGRRKERRANHYREKNANLIGALQCDKGTLVI
jgi:hypothetical protein